LLAVHFATRLRATVPPWRYARLAGEQRPGRPPSVEAATLRPGNCRPAGRSVVGRGLPAPARVAGPIGDSRSRSSSVLPLAEVPIARPPVATAPLSGPGCSPDPRSIPRRAATTPRRCGFSTLADHIHGGGRNRRLTLAPPRRGPCPVRVGPPPPGQGHGCRAPPPAGVMLAEVAMASGCARHVPALLPRHRRVTAGFAGVAPHSPQRSRSSGSSTTTRAAGAALNQLGIRALTSPERWSEPPPTTPDSRAAVRAPSKPLNGAVESPTVAEVLPRRPGAPQSPPSSEGGPRGAWSRNRARGRRPSSPTHPGSSVAWRRRRGGNRDLRPPPPPTCRDFY